MKTGSKALLVAPLAVFFLSGCTQVATAFLTGDPAQYSDCDLLLSGGLAGTDIMCVQCNSGDSPQNSVEKCGVVLTARCNSAAANNNYGVALGGLEADAYHFSVMAATSWYDIDGDGPDTDDIPVCHEQSGILLKNKHEYKCTTALNGPGTDETTFEVEVKYDESLDECL